jgi:predicted small secreted protein
LLGTHAAVRGVFCNRCAKATGASLARFLQHLARGPFARERGTTAMKYAGVLLPLVGAASLTLLSACNTVEGVGRDLERAGDAIQDEAEETRDRRRDD